MNKGLGRMKELIGHLGSNDENVINSPRTRDSPESHSARPSPLHNRDGYEELSRVLTGTWPSQHDMDCILSAGLSTHLHLHSDICTPYSKTIEQSTPSPHEILQRPQPNSHPVLIARKLLLLGTLLQGLVPSSTQRLAKQGVFCHDIMSRVVDSATRLVTTDDDLVRSIEGIECIMIEAMHHNYAGNLRRSWMAVRRAITVAQMMALHRGLDTPTARFLTPEMQAAFDGHQICFRLVDMDCYLSLMLGLPPASFSYSFATPMALERCRPIDRMQRIRCVLGVRILQRNGSDMSEMYDIDKRLQEAADEVSPQWWLMPNLSASDYLHDSIRLMDQLVHYQLLIRLHLPYILRSSHDDKYLHSTMTATTASRETLARFIAFRTSIATQVYCRGTDFVAFIATIVLCLVHIDSRQNSNPNVIAHSRPSDRGMMERTLQVIECRADTDAISSKITPLLGRLLEIEAKVATGTGYTTTSSHLGEEALECHGKLNDGTEGLHVHIPYFGTINFERSMAEKIPDLLNHVDSPYNNCDVGQNQSMAVLGADDNWDLQGVDVAIFDSIFRTTRDTVEEDPWL